MLVRLNHKVHVLFRRQDLDMVKLDGKVVIVIVEERYGSMEADYSIRVLQSRKKLIAAAPVKDPQTGSMRTKVFTVEARAAFIEATTASSVNHENASGSSGIRT